MIDKISKWLADYAKTTGFNGYVIGLSGGIDSAVSASLAVRAVGVDNVLGILLPCTVSGERPREEDIEDAMLIANNLGISAKILDLSTSASELFKPLKKITSIEGKLVLSNIKARLRMTALRAYAEANHCLVLGTTNKTEEYLGYYTKAGDGGAGVDIEPIADLFKYEVFQIARDLKNIPIKIIDRIPSAGLFDNQTDETEIGITYKEIDRYLEFREKLTNTFGFNTYINYTDFMKCSAKGEEIEFEDCIIEKIEQMITINDHKRKNPPSLTNF